MAITKVSVSAQFESLFTRDAIVNTLYFEDLGASDWDGNCGDIAELFDTQWYSSASPQITVKAYDVGGTPPHFPKGTAVRNLGTAAASGGPREQAICLSFYAEHNLPRQRGRIYLTVNGTGQSGNVVRPDTGLRTKVLALATGLAAIGGADVSWQVWSPTDNVGREVTDAWCDDEWDTVRSRGLKATTRELNHTGS